jgi:hypothetical protein
MKGGFMNEREELRLNTTAADKRKFENVMMIREDMECWASAAGVLAEELRIAHTRACNENPVLAILLLDLIRDVAKVDQRICEILVVL